MARLALRNVASVNRQLTTLSQGPNNMNGFWRLHILGGDDDCLMLCLFSFTMTFSALLTVPTKQFFLVNLHGVSTGLMRWVFLIYCSRC